MASKQLRLRLGNFSSRQFAPLRDAAAGAAEYTRRQGRTYRPVSPHLQVRPQMGYAVGSEYGRRLAEAESSEPSDRTLQSFEALRRETAAQHEFMTKELGYRHTVHEQDPLKLSQGGEFSKFRARVGRTRTIPTFSSEATGGHPLGNEFNDQFRAVHDFFGHLATGRGQSRHGEEAAYQSHVQMYSPLAREALTSETRGQNSFMNYRTGQFLPEQKLVGMPRWTQRIRPTRTRTPSSTGNEQGSLF